MTEKMKNKKGFTLVELLVVIGVLGILVLLASPKLLSYLEETQLARIQHDVKVMEQEMTIALLEDELEFPGWDNNDKNLGILVMQNKLFEKEGVAERVDASHLIKRGSLADSESSDKGLGIGGGLYEVNRDLGIGGNNHQLDFTSVDETYKIIPESYKGIIRTKLNGTFYTNEDGKVYYEHDKPLTRNKGKEVLDCPVAIDLGYDFQIIDGKGTIVKWTGTVLHLVIPEAFLMEVNGVEECVPVRVIGKAAFMQGGFKSIVIPQSVITIEEDAFKDNQLTEINIPHSVTYIGGNAFVGNNFGSSGGGGGGGSTITIRNNSSNITIESGAFGGLSPTFKPMSPKDLNVIFEPSSGRIISGQSNSRVITIPESFWVGGVEYPVKKIDKGAYQGQGLISVKLPSGLERIEDYAFAGNQLEGITIPDKVNYIGNYAFAFNEQVHSKSGKARSTIKTIVIKGGEQIGKVNEYGDIYENNTKVDSLNGEVKLLNHIFVTSIGNHVIDNEYVDVKDPVDPEPSKPVYMATDDDFSGTKNGDFRYIGTGQSEIEIPHVIKGIPVTSYYQMFYNSGEDITKVVSTNPNVTNMTQMFYGSQATSLDLSSFNTSNVTNMYGMFYGSQATSLDLSSFDTSKVTDMQAMFWQSQAEALDLSSFNTSNVTNMYAMFDKSQATSLDLSSFDTSNVSDMRYMFWQSKATKGYARTQADANRFNGSLLKPAELTFIVKPGEPSDVYMATDGDFSGTTDGSFRYTGSGQSEIEIPHVIKGVPVTSYYRMFYNGGEDITKVVSTNPNVTSMQQMFEFSQATSLDLSSFDTSKVTTMNFMFMDSQATTLDLSSFNTSNVTNMGSMFQSSQAEALDLSSFDTSKVTNMNQMFYESQATSLDLSSFDTSKANMNWMFRNSQTTTGYARTQGDANKLNSSSHKPAGLTFTVKP